MVVPWDPMPIPLTRGAAASGDVNAPVAGL